MALARVTRPRFVACARGLGVGLRRVSILGVFGGSAEKGRGCSGTRNCGSPRRNSPAHG